MHKAAWKNAQRHRARVPRTGHPQHGKHLGLDLGRVDAGRGIHRLRAGVIDEGQLPVRKSDSDVSYDLTSAGRAAPQLLDSFPDGLGYCLHLLIGFDCVDELLPWNWSPVAVAMATQAT
jgi:hypothetical protein